MANPYQSPSEATIYDNQTSETAAFITKTYLHLFAAILGFTGLEVFLFSSGIADKIAGPLMGNWLIVLGGFMIVGWLANKVASSSMSIGAQYFALAAYVVLQAVIFVPLLWMANAYAPGAIESAAVTTLVGFGALTALVLLTKSDFSFLGAILKWAFLVAIIAIVMSVLFGFNLGTWFSVAMIGLAGGAILHDTSNILHHYPRDRYVAASLSLFASVALLFWYVLSLFLSMSSSD